MDRAVKALEEFSDLYNTGPLIGFSDCDIHLVSRVFEEWFPDYEIEYHPRHPDTEWLVADYNGTRVFAIRYKEEKHDV